MPAKKIKRIVAKKLKLVQNIDSEDAACQSMVNEVQVNECAVEACTALDLAEQEYQLQPCTGEPLKTKKTREEPCQLDIEQEVALVC
jgi:hypothetical protein